MTPFKNDTMCPLHAIIPKRQSFLDGDVNSLSITPNVRYDYLTLYTPSGKPLARSTGHKIYDDIVLNYYGLNFICSPGYGDSVIVVDWFSLVSWAKDCPDDKEILVEVLGEMVEPVEILDNQATLQELSEYDDAYIYGG